MLLKRKEVLWKSKSKAYVFETVKTLLSHLGDCIFSHAASGVLQTYFFLCNGFLIRKVQQVKVISDKRQSHGLAEHVQTHLHVKNRAESMTWAHSFRIARDLTDATPKQGRRNHTVVQYISHHRELLETHFTSPQALSEHETFTHKSASFFFFFFVHQGYIKWISTSIVWLLCWENGECQYEFRVEIACLHLARGCHTVYVSHVTSKMRLVGA